MRTPEEIVNAIELEANESPSFPIFDARESQIIHGLIVKAASEVQAQYDAKIRSFFFNTVYAGGLSVEPDPLATLDEFSARIARKSEEFNEMERNLAEIQSQRDAMRAFLGTGVTK